MKAESSCDSCCCLSFLCFLGPELTPTAIGVSGGIAPPDIKEYTAIFGGVNNFKVPRCNLLCMECKGLSTCQD